MGLPSDTTLRIGGRTPVGYWVCGAPDRVPDELDDLCWSEDARELVSAYLDNGPILARRPGASTCGVCGHQSDHRSLGDASYNWPEALSHHVREHGAGLPRSFVDHVVRQQGSAWRKQVDLLIAELRHTPDDYDVWAVLGDLLVEENDPRGVLIRMACELVDESLDIAQEHRTRATVREYCASRPLVWFENLGLPPSILGEARAVRRRAPPPWSIEVAGMEGLERSWRALAEGRTFDDLLVIAGAGFRTDAWRMWRLGPPIDGHELVGLVMLAHHELGHAGVVAERARYFLAELLDEVSGHHGHVFEELPRTLLWSWIDAASGVAWSQPYPIRRDRFGSLVRSLWSAHGAKLDPDRIRRRLWRLVLHDRHRMLRASPSADVDALHGLARALGTPTAEAIPLAWALLQWDAAHGTGNEDSENAAIRLADAFFVAEEAGIDVGGVIAACREHARSPLPCVFYRE